MLIIKNILVATDFSAASDTALLYGRHFARAYGSTLHIVHVVDDVASRVMPMTGALPDIGAMQTELTTAAEAELSTRVTNDERRSMSVHTAVMTSSAPAQAIVGYAAEFAIDLLVIGTHGRGGLARLFMGSVAQHVVRTAPCPVLTVRQPERDFIAPDVPLSVAEVGARPGHAH